ncbi:MAG: hypothetical protein ABID04_00550 [Patescibacteria group bacterium]
MRKIVWCFHLPLEADILVKSDQELKLGELLATDGEIQFLAPADSRVDKVNEGMIELTFEAEKFDGDFSGLGAQHDGKILLVESASPVFLAKAKTVGVVGIVMIGDNEKNSVTWLS